MMNKVQKFQKLQKCNAGWQMANYILTDTKLGSGSYGQVILGKNQITKEEVAVKTIPFKKYDEKEIKLLDELKALNSPFIAKFREVFEVVDLETYYLIFDLYKGSLDDYFKEYDKKNDRPPGALFKGLSESDALVIFCQIVEGCLAMWSKGITHRDIKPANVLYNFDKNVGGNVFVLTDFGMANNQVASMETQGGTIAYMAPEVIKKEKYDYRVDVWSLGVLLHEMLFGALHVGKGEGTIMIDSLEYRYTLSPGQENKISRFTAMILKNMIKHDPQKRLKKEDLEKFIKGLYEYSFTKQVKDNAVTERAKVNAAIGKENAFISMLEGRIKKFQCSGNPAEDLDMLVKISKNLKPNDKLFLNFNRYCIDNYIPCLKDIAYDKNSLGKVVKMVVELSGKAQQVNFDYSNSKMQIDECNQLAQLQKQHPQNVYLYYNKTIQPKFSPFSNFGQDFNQLYSQLAQLTPSHLVYLHLYAWSSGFGNKEAQKIATILNLIQNLSRLNLELHGNNIQTEGAIQIAHSLQNSHLLSNLFLSFSHNKIQEEGAKQISAVLQKLTNISGLELHFYSTGIGNDGVSNIAQALKMLPNLTNLVFDAGENNLNDTGATAIAKALTTFAHSLTFTLNLDLNKNQIGDAGATQIVKVLATFKGLSHLVLDLKENKIGNVGAIEIVSALKNLKSLSYLKLCLSGNNYSEEAKKFLKEIKANELKIQRA